MFDVTNLSFSTCCLCPTVSAKAMLSSENDRENATHSCPWKKQAIMDIFQEVKHLTLSLIDCRSKRGFGRKTSSGK
jgi:hypothetical protein